LYDNNIRMDIVELLKNRGKIYQIIDDKNEVKLEFIDFIIYYTKINGFPTTSLIKSLKSGKPIKSGKFKGYYLILKDQLTYPNN